MNIEFNHFKILSIMTDPITFISNLYAILQDSEQLAEVLQLMCNTELIPKAEDLALDLISYNGPGLCHLIMTHNFQDGKGATIDDLPF